MSTKTYPTLDEITSVIAPRLGKDETIDPWEMEELQRMQAILSQAELVPLLPRHKIYYASSPHVDNQRFVRVWRETWARIPLKARRALLRHWRSLPLYAIGAAPIFCCVPNLHVDGIEGIVKVFGTCNSYFGSTQYCAYVVNIMPDNILATLIAHELAHPVFDLVEQEQHPEKYTSTHSPFAPLFKISEIDEVERGKDERTVRKMHHRWGFNVKELRQWNRDNRVRLEEMHQAGIGKMCRCGDAPEAFQAYLDRGIKLHNRHKYQAALRYAEQAALIKPQNRTVLILIGSCYFYLAQLDRSIEVFQRAARLYPTSQEVSQKLRLALSIANRNEEAFAEIKRSLAVGDSDHFTEILVGYMKVLEMARNDEPEEIIVEDMKQELRNGESDLFDEFTSIVLKALNKKQK